MKEFIVWDKKKNEFIDEHNVLVDGSGTNIHNFNRDSNVRFNRDDKKELEILFAIGKDDINGNKIYADSSICMLERSKSIGTFFFDKKYLRYKFAFNGDKDVSLPMNDFEKDTDFKIIGTLQEDKHLLGEEK